MKVSNIGEERAHSTTPTRHPDNRTTFCYSTKINTTLQLYYYNVRFREDICEISMQSFDYADTQISNFTIKHLRKNEKKFETVIAYSLSRIFYKKSRDTYRLLSGCSYQS